MDIDREKRKLTATSSTGSTTRAKPLLENYVDSQVNGTVMDMAQLTAGGQNVLCYVTTRGKLYGLDLRSNDTVWSLTNSAKFGVSVCLCLFLFLSLSLSLSLSAFLCLSV